MKPARSPRFQSPALRASSASISRCGSPNGTCGAAHARMTAPPTACAQRLAPTAVSLRTEVAPAHVMAARVVEKILRERLEEMARATREALPHRAVEVLAAPLRRRPFLLRAPLCLGSGPLGGGLLRLRPPRRLLRLFRRGLRLRSSHRLLIHRPRGWCRRGRRR